MADRLRRKASPTQDNIVQNIRALARFYGLEPEDMAFKLGITRRRWRTWLKLGKGPRTIGDAASIAAAAGLDVSDLCGAPDTFRLALTSGAFEAHKR